MQRGNGRARLAGIGMTYGVLCAQSRLRALQAVNQRTQGKGKALDELVTVSVDMDYDGSWGTPPAKGDIYAIGEMLIAHIYDEEFTALSVEVAYAECYASIRLYITVDAGNVAELQAEIQRLTPGIQTWEIPPLAIRS